MTKKCICTRDVDMIKLTSQLSLFVRFLGENDLLYPYTAINLLYRHGLHWVSSNQRNPRPYVVTVPRAYLLATIRSHACYVNRNVRYDSQGTHRDLRMAVNDGPTSVSDRDITLLPTAELAHVVIPVWYPFQIKCTLWVCGTRLHTKIILFRILVTWRYPANRSYSPHG